MMITAAIILFVFALLLLGFVRRNRRKSGLPSGRVIYTDMDGWEKVQSPLYDPEINLTGRPDYLVQEGKQITPVEVKSSHVKDTPYEGHVYQLMAYCRLVESEFGMRPEHGILHYANRTFSIEYTNTIATALLELVDEIRSNDQQNDVNRSHDSAARCRSCGFGSTCEENIANY